jgi:uncharacterized protein (TIGR04222 family)
MNPLDMTGPEFLGFYLAWGAGGLLLAWVLRTFWLKNLDTPLDVRRWIPGYYPQHSEAYAIAFLRGGEGEAVSALLGRLVSTGFLTFEGGKIRRIHDEERERPLLPIEKRALEALGSSTPASKAGSTLLLGVGPQLQEMRRDLEGQGLLSSQAGRRPWNTLRRLTMLAVPGLGVAKLWVAVDRGRSNIGFLMILILAYSVATLLLLSPPRLTLAGRRYLEWLRESHQGLVRQAASGERERGIDLTLATGIFGLAAVPSLTGLDSVLGLRRRDGGDGGDASSWGSGGSGGDSGGGDGGGSGCGGCGGGD